MSDFFDPEYNHYALPHEQSGEHAVKILLDSKVTRLAQQMFLHERPVPDEEQHILDNSYQEMYERLKTARIAGSILTARASLELLHQDDQVRFLAESPARNTATAFFIGRSLGKLQVSYQKLITPPGEPIVTASLEDRPFATGDVITTACDACFYLTETDSK